MNVQPRTKAPLCEDKSSWSIISKLFYNWDKPAGIRLYCSCYLYKDIWCLKISVSRTIQFDEMHFSDVRSCEYVVKDMGFASVSCTSRPTKRDIGVEIQCKTHFDFYICINTILVHSGRKREGLPATRGWLLVSLGLCSVSFHNNAGRRHINWNIPEDGVTHQINK